MGIAHRSTYGTCTQQGHVHMITSQQIESIVLDDILYVAVLTGILVMSFGLGLLVGAIWLL